MILVINNVRGFCDIVSKNGNCEGSFWFEVRRKCHANNTGVIDQIYERMKEITLKKIHLQ